MPMYLHVGAEGRIRSTGPTMARLLGPRDPIGQAFLDLFALRRPRSVQSIAAFSELLGQRLHLQLRRPPCTAFRGLALPLFAESDDCGGTGPDDAAPGGFLVNLSFGLTVSTAVREHGLTEGAFAPTDLTIEMLYLTEAKTAVMQELHNLNSRLHQAKTEAEDQALTDALTGLRNRRALELRIRSAAVARIPFGLMQIDLDRFKAVNDTLGHAAGDHVLTHVAKILLKETREIDTVARVGGDEFVIIFPKLTHTPILARIAKRMLHQIREPVDYQGAPCRVSASIGVTASGAFGSGPIDDAKLLQHVDRALYASKNSGRDCVTIIDPLA
jgi:diguanylate cyclase (GGDEF)-like protein